MSEPRTDPDEDQPEARSGDPQPGDEGAGAPDDDAALSGETPTEDLRADELHAPPEVAHYAMTSEPPAPPSAPPAGSFATPGAAPYPPPPATAPGIPGAPPPIAGAAPIAPPVLRPPPAPRPPVVPQRLADGSGWSTPNVVVRRADDRGNVYIDYKQGGTTQTVYLASGQLRRLVHYATSPQHEPGEVWKRFSDIPLTRPLPSRTLDEELRLVLMAHAGQTVRVTRL